MMPGIDPLTLILLAAAAVVFWRLRAVLGQRTGFERPPFDPSAPIREARPQPNAPAVKKDIEATAQDVTPVWSGHAEAGSPLASALEAIAARSPGFTVESFKSGAAVAYEMIVEGFAKGDKQALKPLLSKEVFDGFVSAIDQRNKAGQKKKFQFVGLKSATLQQASLKGNMASLTVRFVSEVIDATMDAAGKVVEGDPRAIQDVVDVWTFERDVTARDPNWKLVDTQDQA